MLKYALKVLGPVLRTEMSEDISRSTKTDVDGSMYIDDFLGDDDINLFNKSVVY
jgi:hypothetical protein